MLYECWCSRDAASRVSDLSYERRINLLKVPDNIKDKAIEKLKSMKGNFQGDNKAQSWLDGFLKIPFGIYKENTLIGGLYGVQLGGVFFGESMFSHASNASKIAFHHLVLILRANDFMLLDSQYLNDHTEMLGAIEIPQELFLTQLRKNSVLTRQFTLE